MRALGGTQRPAARTELVRKTAGHALAEPQVPFAGRAAGVRPGSPARRKVFPE